MQPFCCILRHSYWTRSNFEAGAYFAIGAQRNSRPRALHCDSVKRGGKESAPIAIRGSGPIAYNPVNPGKPNLRVL